MDPPPPLAAAAAPAAAAVTGADPGTCDIPVWLDGTQRWVTGLTKRTTCDDVIYALLYSNGLHETQSTDSYAIFEKWREVERPLSSRTKLVKVWHFWGQEQPNVQLSMRHVDDYFFPGDSSLYLRSRRKHKRSSRVKSRHASHGKYTSRKGCVECTRLKSLEQLVELVVCQERKIKEIQERIEHTDRLVITHEAKIHQHRVEHNGLDYVTDSYLNSHSSSSSSSIDSSVFTTIDLKKVKDIFPQSSWQDLEDIMRMCDDISGMEKRKSDELLKLNRKMAEVDCLVESDRGETAILKETNNELEQIRVNVVRAVSAHLTQDDNEKELDRKMAVLDQQILDKQQLMWDLQNQLKDTEEREEGGQNDRHPTRNPQNLSRQTNPLHSPHQLHYEQHYHHPLQQHHQQYQHQDVDQQFSHTAPIYLSQQQQQQQQSKNIPSHSFQSKQYQHFNDDQENQHHHQLQHQQSDHHLHNSNQRQQQQQYQSDNQTHHPQQYQYRYHHHHHNNNNNQQQYQQQQHPHYNPLPQHHSDPTVHHPPRPHTDQLLDQPHSIPTPTQSHHHSSINPPTTSQGNTNSRPIPTTKDSYSRSSRPTSRGGQRSSSMSQERSRSEDRIRSHSETYDSRVSPFHQNDDTTQNTHAQRNETKETNQITDAIQTNQNCLNYKNMSTSKTEHLLSNEHQNTKPNQQQQYSNIKPHGMNYTNYRRDNNFLVKHSTENTCIDNAENSNNAKSTPGQQPQHRQTFDLNWEQSPSVSFTANAAATTSIINTSQKQQHGEREQTGCDVTTSKHACLNNIPELDQREPGQNVNYREFNHMHAAQEGGRISLHKESEQRDAVFNQQEKNRIYLERLLIQQQKQRQPSDGDRINATACVDQHKTTRANSNDCKTAKEQTVYRVDGEATGGGGDNSYGFDRVATNFPQCLTNGGKFVVGVNGDGDDEDGDDDEYGNETENGLCYNVKTSKIGVIPNNNGRSVSSFVENKEATNRNQFSSPVWSDKNMYEKNDELKGRVNMLKQAAGCKDPLPSDHNNPPNGFNKDTALSQSRRTGSDNNDNGYNKNNVSTKTGGEHDGLKSFPTKVMARFPRHNTALTNGINMKTNALTTSTFNKNNYDQQQQQQRTFCQPHTLQQLSSPSNQTKNSPNVIYPRNQTQNTNSNKDRAPPDTRTHQLTRNDNLVSLTTPPAKPTTLSSSSHSTGRQNTPLSSSSPTSPSTNQDASTPNPESSNRGALYHILSNKLNKSTSKLNTSGSSGSKSNTSSSNASISKPLPQQHHKQHHSPSDSFDSINAQDNHTTTTANTNNLPYCSSTSSSSTTINQYLSSDDTTSSSNSKKSSSKKEKEKLQPKSNETSLPTMNGHVNDLAQNQSNPNIGKSFLMKSKYKPPESTRDHHYQTHNLSKNVNSNNSPSSLPQTRNNNNNNNNNSNNSNNISSNPIHAQNKSTSSNSVQNTGHPYHPIPQPIKHQTEPTSSTSSNQQQTLKSPAAHRRGINPNFCDISKDVKKSPSALPSDGKPSGDAIHPQPHSGASTLFSYASTTGEEFGNRNINFANIVFGGEKSGKLNEASNPNIQNQDRKVDVKSVLDKRQTEQSREVRYTKDGGNVCKSGVSTNNSIGGKGGFITSAGNSSILGRTKMEDSNDSNSDTGLSSMHSDETANLETLV